MPNRQLAEKYRFSKFLAHWNLQICLSGMAFDLCISVRIVVMRIGKSFNTEDTQLTEQSENHSKSKEKNAPQRPPGPQRNDKNNPGFPSAISAASAVNIEFFYVL